MELERQLLGSDAILTVFPDIVEFSADAFPQSAGEATHSAGANHTKKDSLLVW